MKAPEPMMTSAWSVAEIFSALPWPYLWSWSAGWALFLMAKKFTADIKTSDKLSRAEATTAIDPERSPTRHLHTARVKAEQTAKADAFCFESIFRLIV